MKLHNRSTSFLNTLPEGTPEPNIKPRITRWIYFGILLSVVAYLIYIGTERVIYSQATGQVEVENVTISTSISGRIEKMIATRNQAVKKGDLIAKIAANKNCIEQPDKNINQLSYDIELNKSQLDILRIRLRSLNQPEQNQLIRRALEVSRDQVTQNKKTQKEKRKIREEIALLKREIKLQNKKLSTQTLLLENKVIPPECKGETILAPFDGVIQAVLQHSQEFSKRGAPIVVMTTDQAPVSIFVQFKQNELRYLTQGKIVDIFFPDGKKGHGLIDTIYSIDYSQLNINKTTSKEEGTVRVRLSATDEQSRQHWKKYDRMNVIVRLKK